jgi:hypothetical protein
MQIRQLKKLAVTGLWLGFGTILVVTRSWWAPRLLARVFLRCEEEVKQQMPSGDGRYIARVVERNCGATTRVHTELELRSSGTWPSAKDQKVFVQDNQCPIGLTWTGDTLRVAYQDPCGKVLQSFDSWSDIHFRFSPDPPS